jgi:drug/metabolite transporter (DMT)-like permease
MAAIALAVAGYFLFSVQDAAVKWLVADHTVWEILLVRSLTITLLCLAIGRAAWPGGARIDPEGTAAAARGGHPGCLSATTERRDLQLAELVTIYFAAPLMVTALSSMLLKEQVRWQRWAVVSVSSA